MWKYRFSVPDNKKVRVIVHTDCKNEADDQYALAHHLMTERRPGNGGCIDGGIGVRQL